MRAQSRALTTDERQGLTSPGHRVTVAVPTNRDNRAQVELVTHGRAFYVWRAREYHVSSTDVNPAIAESVSRRNEAARGEASRAPVQSSTGGSTPAAALAMSRFGGTATRSVQLGGGALVHISGNIAGYRELSTGALLLAGA